MDSVLAGARSSAAEVRAGKAATTGDDAYLSMEGIVKNFPGVQALKQVSFNLHRGEIHCLVGENGAGKSTLMKVLAGLFPPDKGTILFDGKPIVLHGPVHAQRLGIAMVFQELAVLPNLDVESNIVLGREHSIGVPGWIDFGACSDEARRALQLLGEDIPLKTRLDQLGVGLQQMVEIARAISAKAHTLILDEPTSALTGVETERLFRVVRQLRDGGLGIVYISHRLDEVLQIGDRVTVLRDGEHVRTSPVGEVDRDTLVELMVGRSINQTRSVEPIATGDTILEVRNLTGDRGRPTDVSFDLRKGEIIGVAGLLGSGRTELARAIFGADRITSGKILLNGEEVKIKSPKDAVRLGIAHTPEDRRTEGIFSMLSVEENIVMSSLPTFTRLGVVSRPRLTKLAQDFVARLRIRTTGIDQEVQYLSGGNQQKVVIARWMATPLKVIILDEPTAGIDVGAKAEVAALIRDLAQRGIGVIVISSELEEVLLLSSRILVMHDYHLEGELIRAEATQEGVMRLATGTHCRFASPMATASQAGSSAPPA